jgi:transmembrane sensor
MSGAHVEKPVRIAKDIKARATGWFERRDRPDWSADDQAALDAWLAASPAHLIAYWRVESAWSRIERLVAVRPAEAKDATHTRPRRFPFFRWVAAVVVIVASATGAAFLLRGSDRQTYATTVGGREILTLADGTYVELNTDTVLEVSTRKGERKVWLDRGEAYFQVVHDSRHSFQVIVGDHAVTDLGTVFSIRRDADYLKVAVMDGRVGLASKDTLPQSQPLLLTRGDVAIATPDAISVTKSSEADLSNELGWRRGVLVFYHTSLADAVGQLNRYNREKIVIADDAVGKRMVDGTFPANRVQPFVEVARAIFGLHVKKLENEIVISR